MNYKDLDVRRSKAVKLNHSLTPPWCDAGPSSLTSDMEAPLYMWWNIAVPDN